MLFLVEYQSNVNYKKYVDLISRYELDYKKNLCILVADSNELHISHFFDKYQRDIEYFNSSSSSTYPEDPNILELIDFLYSLNVDQIKSFLEQLRSKFMRL